MYYRYKCAAAVACIAFSFGIINPAKAQNSARQIKEADCQAIANLFEGSSANFQNTGNLSSSLTLVDRLMGGLNGLQLRDPKLINLQGRYVRYFASANELLQTAGKTQTSANGSGGSEGLMALAQANSAVGSQLSQELVEYCLQ